MALGPWPLAVGCWLISSSNKNNIYIYLTASGKVFAPPGGCSLGVVAVAVFCFFVVVFYRLALLLTRKSRYAAAMQI